MDTTVTSSPLNVTLLPTDFDEATGNNLDTGKLRSSITFNIVRPTIPVAPTMATRMGAGFCDMDSLVELCKRRRSVCERFGERRAKIRGLFA
jgi:hypothetical protein